MVTWRVRAFTVLSLMIYHCVLSCVFGVSDNSVASVRTLRGKSAHNLLDNTIDHTDEANDLESLSSLSSLSSSSSSSFHTSDHDYIDRYRTCFGCKIILSSSVTNKNLYDSSSLVAIMSSILRIMDEKEDSITYNRDPSKLCSYSGEESCSHTLVLFTYACCIHILLLYWHTLVVLTYSFSFVSWTDTDVTYAN
jgi:hypothetical protein